MRADDPVDDEYDPGEPESEDEKLLLFVILHLEASRPAALPVTIRELQV